VLRRAFLTEKAQEPQKPLALAAAERWSAKSA